MVSLDDFNNLGALMTPSNTREAFNIDISLIDEDPEQPRTSENPGFSEESIEELAETVRTRGIKSPISLRKINDGRYIINHGARRYRAAIKAGLTQIPAFVDNDYSKLDQVIENIQRNNLTPNEIAAFIAEELSMGQKKVDIAKELGKSSAWVTQYCTLLELPSELEICWQVGVFGDDVTAVAELSKLYKKYPERVLSFIADAEKITRKEVTNLKDIIEDPSIDPSFARANNFDKKAIPSNQKQTTQQNEDEHKLSNININPNNSANTLASPSNSTCSSSSNANANTNNSELWNDNKNEDESENGYNYNQDNQDNEEEYSEVDEQYDSNSSCHNDGNGNYNNNDLTNNNANRNLNQENEYSIGAASQYLENFDPNNYGGFKSFGDIKCMYGDVEVLLMPIHLDNSKVVVKKVNSCNSENESNNQELYFAVKLEDLELKQIEFK